LTGSWGAWENLVYYRFMADNYSDFLTERDRRRSKVFFRLSKILKKRTADQCRSHHQKLQLKYRDDLPTIMNEVLKKIQKAMAEDLVNGQFNFHGNFPFKGPEMTSASRAHLFPISPFKLMAQDDWYSISSNVERLQISICADKLQEW
jgi:hypothetical protein